MREASPPHDPGPLRGVLAWIDPRFGPLRNLVGQRLGPPEPRWWLYHCDLARAPVGTRYCPDPAGAAGTSLDPDEAFRRALGEAVERYSALNVGARGGVALAAGDGELTGRFPACAPDEPCPPPLRGLDRAAPLTHVAVRRLADGREVMVPAAFVHLGFRPRPLEPAPTLPISTGLAFHPSLHDALWGGLCEVIERDAMMLMWWARRPLAAIPVDGPDLPEPLADRVARLKSARLSVHLFDMTSDVRIPAVFAVVRGESYPYLVVGAACRSDPVVACTKALDEAVSVRAGLRARPPGPLPSLGHFDWVCALEHHARLYAAWRRTPAFDFLLDPGGLPTPFPEFVRQPWGAPPEGPDGLAFFAAGLEAEGLTVLWADVTAPEAAEFGRVVKVIVPEMVPLSQAHSARWLATPRLLRAAGLARARASDFNPFPHPFA
jgi:ribosomal protein S12 methylthiotransferase accessory factor